MVGSKVWVVIFLALSLLPLAHAVDHVIINSQDWRDVYTGTQYAYLEGIPSNFLVSTRHSTILLYSIPVDRDEIEVFSSTSRPYIVGYEDILRSRGYDQPSEVRTPNLNLYLLDQLEDINRFIVIDDAYGYNAISVAPFAIQDKSFVIFANSNNIEDIVGILQDKNPEKVLIYGQVDREVKDGLAEFNVETINFGNRFANNVEIVKRYQQIRPTSQVILTNGEFIEAGIMSGADPVLFLGRENVPESVRNFIDEGGIEVGILIGNELVNAATFVRRQLGISVFVKFAQGARQPAGSIAQVEDLDRFPMPVYSLGIEITSIVYNKATGSLEVTYHNTVNLAEYFKDTITVRDGSEVDVLGDSDALFLDQNEYKTVVYSVDVNGDPLNFQSNELTGDAFVIYGEGANSLEQTYQKSFEIDIVEVLDDADIEIIDLVYDKSNQAFIVTIENTGEVTAYVSSEIVDLIINDEALTVGSADVAKIEQGKKNDIEIPVEMDDQDFLDNEKIKVRAYYGERELSRIKLKEKAFPLVFASNLVKYAVYGALILLILWFLFFLGTKKKCKHCGKENARGRKTCIKCGQPFRGGRRPSHPHPPVHK